MLNDQVGTTVQVNGFAERSFYLAGNAKGIKDRLILVIELHNLFLFRSDLRNIVTGIVPYPLIINHYFRETVIQQIAQDRSRFSFLAQDTLCRNSTFQVILNILPGTGQIRKIGMEFSRIFSFSSSTYDYTKVFRLDAFHDFLQAFSFFCRMYFAGDRYEVVERSQYNETPRK
ncbi:hypothetical protein D3C72_509660 [compost metagenome]